MSGGPKKPIDTSSTDIGNGSAKILAGARPAAARIDTSDEDQVFDLAAEIVTGTRRRAMQLTIKETRAIAGYAVVMGVIASQACDYLDLLSAGAPEAEIAARLKALRELAGRST